MRTQTAVEELINYVSFVGVILAILYMLFRVFLRSPNLDQIRELIGKQLLQMLLGGFKRYFTSLTTIG